MTSILIESVDDLEELPEGSVVALRGGLVSDGAPAYQYAEKAAQGWCLSSDGAPEVMSDASLVYWFNRAPFSIELLYVPGYVQLHETDFDFGLASATVLNALIELLNTKAAIQMVEFGLAGLPIYFEANELLSVVYAAADKYNIEEWGRAVNGKDV